MSLAVPALPWFAAGEEAATTTAPVKKIEEITGEGLAAHSGNYRQFTSVTARIELTLQRGDKVLAVDRHVETLAGGNYAVTAKRALGQAALRLAARLLLQLQ